MVVALTTTTITTTTETPNRSLAHSAASASGQKKT